MQDLDSNNLYLIKDKKVLVEFYSENCIPCRKMVPVLEKIEEDLEDILVFKTSLENNKKFFEKYNINSVPTILLMNESTELKRIVGLVTYDNLVNFLND